MVLAGVTLLLAAGSFVTVFVTRDQLAEMRLEQRAWVGVDGLRGFALKAGQNFSVPFDVTNTGKTPALRVEMKASSRSLPRDQKFTPMYASPYSLKSSVTVIQPQMHTVLPTFPSPVSPAQYEDVQSGSDILYAYGNITYADIYGNPHETTFCVMYYSGLSAPVACDVYNSAN